MSTVHFCYGYQWKQQPAVDSHACGGQMEGDCYLYAEGTSRASLWHLLKAIFCRRHEATISHKASENLSVTHNWGGAFLFHYILQLWGSKADSEEQKQVFNSDLPYWYDGSGSWHFGMTCLVAVTCHLAGYMIYISRIQDDPHASHCGYSLWDSAQINTQMNRKKEL